MGKASGTKGCCSCFLKECQCAGCKCNICSKVFIIIVTIIIMKNTVMYLFSSKNKLIHSLQFDTNIVDLTCIYSSPPPPHTSLLIYSVSAGSIRVLLSQCTLSKLFHLFILIFFFFCTHRRVRNSQNYAGNIRQLLKRVLHPTSVIFASRCKQRGCFLQDERFSEFLFFPTLVATAAVPRSRVCPM